MGFDTLAFQFLNSPAGKNRLIDFLGIFLAEYLPYILVIVAIVFIFREKKLRLRIYYIALVILAELIGRGFITETVRFFYPRLRPFVALGIHPLITEASSSFPSGHAVFFGVLATILLLMNRKAGVWFWVATIFMGIARVFTGVHWISDIIAGFGVGILSALFSIWLIQKFFVVKENPVSQDAVPPSEA